MITDAFEGATEDDDFVMEEAVEFVTIPKSLANETRSKVCAAHARVRCEIDASAPSSRFVE